MSKNVKLFLLIATSAVCLLLALVFVSKILVTLGNQNDSISPGYIDNTRGDVESVEGYETLSESNEYSDEKLDTYKIDNRVTYETPIEEFVNIDRLSEELTKSFGTCAVVDFAGGKYGIFVLQIRSSGAEYESVWDDENTKLYVSIEEYNKSGGDLE